MNNQITILCVGRTLMLLWLLWIQILKNSFEINCPCPLVCLSRYINPNDFNQYPWHDMINNPNNLTILIYTYYIWLLWDYLGDIKAYFKMSLESIAYCHKNWSTRAGLLGLLWDYRLWCDIKVHRECLSTIDINTSYLKFNRSQQSTELANCRVLTYIYIL